MSRSRKKGHTLIEVMVASALMLMVTGACAMVLRSSLRYLRRLDALTEMEAKLTQVLGGLSRDIGESSKRSMHWEPLLPALTLASPRDATGSLRRDPLSGNRVLFAQMIRYDIDAEQRFVRYTDPVDPPMSLAPHPIDNLTPPRDAAYWSNPSLNRKVLAEGVVEFTVSPVEVDPDTGESPCPMAGADLVRIKLRFERKFDKLYGVECQLGTVPRN